MPTYYATTNELSIYIYIYIYSACFVLTNLVAIGTFSVDKQCDNRYGYFKSAPMFVYNILRMVLM